MMSAVVYDVGYDTRMIKKGGNMVKVWFLAFIKEKNFARHKPPKKYQDWEAPCHI